MKRVLRSLEPAADRDGAEEAGDSTVVGASAIAGNRYV